MNKLNLLIRLLILVSPFLVPWWLVLVFVLAAFSMYDSYYEVIAIGLICDVLYLTSQSFVGMYGLTLAACALLVIGQQIKKRLIMY